MRFKWTTELNGRVGIVAENAGYDGTPWVQALWMDRPPHEMSHDRVAAAAALTFGPWCGGDMEFEYPVAAGVASAIRHLIPEAASIVPTDFAQHPFPFGAGTARLTTDVQLAPLPGAAGDAEVGRICVLDSAVFTGSMRTHRSVAVASNAALHDERARQQGRLPLATLAVALLYAGDLGIDCIQAPPELVTPAARRLLVACGTRLVAQNARAIAAPA